MNITFSTYFTCVGPWPLGPCPWSLGPHGDGAVSMYRVPDPHELSLQTSSDHGSVLVTCSFGKTCPPAGYHVFVRLEYLLISLIKYKCQANFSKRALRDDPFSYLSISKIAKRADLLVWIIFIFHFHINSLFFICFIILYE